MKCCDNLPPARTVATPLRQHERAAFSCVNHIAWEIVQWWPNKNGKVVSRGLLSQFLYDSQSAEVTGHEKHAFTYKNMEFRGLGSITEASRTQSTLTWNYVAPSPHNKQICLAIIMHKSAERRGGFPKCQNISWPKARQVGLAALVKVSCAG